MELFQVFSIIEVPAYSLNHQICFIFWQFTAPRCICELVFLKHLLEIAPQLVLKFHEVPTEIIQNWKKILIKGCVGEIKDRFLKVLLASLFHFDKILTT
jgi:hypothetical protein